MLARGDKDSFSAFSTKKEAEEDKARSRKEPCGIPFCRRSTEIDKLCDRRLSWRFLSAEVEEGGRSYADNAVANPRKGR